MRVHLGIPDEIDQRLVCRLMMRLLESGSRSSRPDPASSLPGRPDQDCDVELADVPLAAPAEAWKARPTLMPSIAETALPKARRVVCMSCSQQCGLLAHVTEGRVTKLTGDREHPVSQGFICSKGAASTDLLYHPQRLTTPLKRAGPRGAGEWKEMSWGDALDEIADELGRLRSLHGPETIAHAHGTVHAADFGMGERFLNLLGSPNTVGQDKICAGPIAMGDLLTFGWGPTYNVPVAGTTGCAIVWASHPSASAPLLWGAITRARRAGMKLIVVDPRRTHEAAKADLFLQIRPGTDGALALAMINVIIHDALCDTDFVARETTGFTELAEHVKAFTPGDASTVTSIPAEQIVSAARMFALSGPAVIHGGAAGLSQRGPGSVQTSRALACLIAITGNIRPGAHQLLGPPRDIVANGRAVACDALSAGQRAKRIGGDVYPAIGTGHSDLAKAVARVWHGDTHAINLWCSAHEPSLWNAILTREPYPIAGLILQYHNALGSSANAREVGEALLSANLELLVTHDLFMNKTASVADYVLPAAHWLEKPFYSTTLGYVGFSGDYVEAGRQAVTGVQLTDYQLWRELGRRLGQERDWPDTVEAYWDELLGPADLTHAEVSDHLGPLTGASARNETEPDSELRAGYGTPSGKIELRSSLLEAWGLDGLPSWHQSVLAQRYSEEFPLWLVTGGRNLRGFHQNAQQLPTFRETNPDPVASINRETLGPTEIRDGEWILITTPVGAVTQKVRFSADVAPGVVMADRWWYPERAEDPTDPFGFWRCNINVCSPNGREDCDEVMGSWPLRSIPCRIEVP